MLLHSMDTRKTSIALCLGASLASVAALLQAAPASAAPSETLSQQVRDAQSAEADRQFGKAIDIYGLAIGSAPSDQALRLLLKRRALAFEKISLLPKAEADFTRALAVELPARPATERQRSPNLRPAEGQSKSFACPCCTATCTEPVIINLRFGSKF